MSLISFHRFLIAAGIVFCVGFSVWELRAWFETGRVGALLLAAVFLVLGIGLMVYLRRLNRFLGYRADG